VHAGIRNECRPQYVATGDCHVDFVQLRSSRRLEDVNSEKRERAVTRLSIDTDVQSLHEPIVTVEELAT